MIYFDNAATTKVDKEVIFIINRYNTECYFNPSALYKGAIEVTQEIKNARKKIANVLHADSSTITFTSSATESNNHVMLSAKGRKGSRIIISELEHAAIYTPANELKQQGYDVVFCPLCKEGRVDIDAFSKLLNDNTSLVSIIHVSNETGNINDIQKLVQLTKNFNPNIHFHSDGVQAFCKMPVFVEKLGVDSYSISGHKIGAPKGIAALYIRKGIHLKPLIFGGGQEAGRRASTENVSGIAAFGYAAEKGGNRILELHDNCLQIFNHIKSKLQSIDNVIFLTNSNSAPHILTFAMPDVRGEIMMHALEAKNIFVGIGSACTSKKKPNRLKKALNLPDAYEDNIIRLSISLENTLNEAIAVADTIIEEYNKLNIYTRG